MNVSTDLTVICPTYNSAGFIRATLQSVMAQTRPPWEVIVSDDGSIDDTCEIVERFPVERGIRSRLLRNRHRGPSASRNRAIRAATTDWIAFIDSDDKWYLDKLECIENEIAAHPECDFFSHNVDEWRGQVRREIDFAAGISRSLPIGPQLVMKNFFTASATVCRRSLLLSAGLFDEKLWLAEDYDLWFRLAPLMRVRFVPDVLGVRVFRTGSLSNANPEMRLASAVAVLWRHREYAGGLLIYLIALARQIAAYGLLRLRQLMRLRWPASDAGTRLAPVDSERLPHRIFPLAYFPVKGIKRVLRSCGLASDASLRVLLFHDIAPQDRDNFRRLMNRLAEEWRFVDAQTFVEMIGRRQPVEGRNLLLTFDDAFQSNVWAADEVLAPLQIKAIFFVPYDFVQLRSRDDQRQFIADRIFDGAITPTSIPAEQVPMFAGDVIRLAKTGHSIGCHTKTHARLSTLLDVRQLREEIEWSGDALQQLIGSAVEYFAYPFGDCSSINRRALRIASARYKCVFSGTRGPNGMGGSRYSILRDSFRASDSYSFVSAMLDGGIDWYHQAEIKQLHDTERSMM